MNNTPGPMAVVRSELQQMRGQFAAALPKQIPPERFERIVLTAIQREPKLLGVERRSLWNAAMQAAQDGLLPDGREGAMVIYGGKTANFIPMVRGLLKKARNSGEIASWDVRAVHQNDHFKHQYGDDPKIEHTPTLDDPGKLIAVYSIVILKSGEKSREVMSMAEVERIRKSSPSRDSGPWKDHYEEMAKKTVIRRHSKMLPTSSDLDDLIRREDDLGNNEPAKVEPQRIGNTLDAFADEPSNQVEEINKETGEIAARHDEIDAYALGFEARQGNRALKAVPPEWRNAQHASEAAAWTDGWHAADKEIMDAATKPKS